MCPGVDSASENEYQVNPGGKGGWCVRLTTYHLHVPMSRNLGALTSWNPVGLFRPVMGKLCFCYRFSCTCNIVDRHGNFGTNVKLVRIFETFIAISKKLKWNSSYM
jgi:hypothetical protein